MMLLWITNPSVSMISFASAVTVQWSNTIPSWNAQLLVGIHLTLLPIQQLTTWTPSTFSDCSVHYLPMILSLSPPSTSSWDIRLTCMLSTFLEQKMLLQTLCHDTTMTLPQDWYLVSAFPHFNPLRMYWGWPKNDQYPPNIPAAHY